MEASQGPLPEVPVHGYRNLTGPQAEDGAH